MNLTHKIKIKKNRDLLLIEKCLLIIVLIFAYLIFMYGDLTNTIDNANILLTTIKHGKMLEFYDISVKLAKTNFSANYNFIIYIIFAIWQAPAYLLAHMFQKEYLECLWTMLWSKTLVILFSMMVALYIYKIVSLITENKKKASLAVFLFYSSMIVFYPVFICGQLDVISMTFMLGGIYNYLKGNKFLFWFNFFVATPCKMFSLLLALPLILLKEKNLIKAGFVWISMMGMLIGEKILFHASPVYKYALGSQSRDAISALLGANVNLGCPINIFIVCYLAIVLYAYISKTYSKELIVYMAFFIWGTFTSLSAINTYWVFLVAPFCIMSICIGTRFLNAAILVETIGSVSYLVGIICAGTAVFRYSDLVKHLILPQIIVIPGSGKLKYDNLVNFFEINNLMQYRPLFATIYVAAIMALLVLTCPLLQKKNEKAEIDKYILFMRPVLLGVVSIMLIYVYIAKTNIVAYDTRNESEVVAKSDLMSSEKRYIITQEMSFNDNRQLDELILKFNNTLYWRANMGLLHVEIWNMTDRKCIYKQIIGCSDIKSDKDIRIDLEKVKVFSNKEYQIKLYAQSGIEYYKETAKLFPYFVKHRVSELKYVKVNGKEKKKYLYFQIR